MNGQPLVTTWLLVPSTWIRGVPQLRSQSPTRETRHNSFPSDRRKDATKGVVGSSQSRTMRSRCRTGNCRSHTRSHTCRDSTRPDLCSTAARRPDRSNGVLRHRGMPRGAAHRSPASYWRAMTSGAFDARQARAKYMLPEALAGALVKAQHDPSLFVTILGRFVVAVVTDAQRRLACQTYSGGEEDPVLPDDRARMAEAGDVGLPQHAGYVACRRIRVPRRTRRIAVSHTARTGPPEHRPVVVVRLVSQGHAW